MRARVPIIAPKHGLNDRFAYSEQPGLTTPLSKNTRSEESATGRLRLAQRAGFTKYTPFELFKNYASYTSRLRANAQDDGVSPTLGWQLSPQRITVATDTTLAPDGFSLAESLVQFAGISAGVIHQIFDTKATSGNPKIDAHPGATFLQASPGDVVFSIFVKAKDATTSRIIIRQSEQTITPGDGLPLRSELVTWTAGVPSLSTLADSGSNTGAGVSDEGDGWYRIYVQCRWDTGSEGTSSVLHCSLVPNQTDSTAKGIYVWGAQVELATTPSAYEPVGRKNDLEGKRKVASLTHLSHIQRGVTYSELGAPAVTVLGKTPNSLDAARVALDRQDSRYVLEGTASVVKYTADGELVYEIPVPVKDPTHVIRALHVDAVDCVYAGVTSGGDQKTARLFKYLQGPKITASGDVEDEAFHLLWELETGAYIVNVFVREALLYTLQSDDISGSAEVVVYENIDDFPEVLLRFDVPYTSNKLEVKSDGFMVVCSPENATRGVDPRFATYKPRMVSWTPEDYTDWDTKGRAWLDATRINGKDTDTTADYAQDDEVDRWVDLTANERNVFKNPSRKRPTVNLLGASGMPGVHFNGVDQALISNPNPDEDANSNHLHKTLWPGYATAEYTCFVCFSPAVKATQGMVIGQQNSNAGAEERAICSNRDESDTISNPVSAQICHFDDTTGTGDPATGTDGHPASTTITNGTKPNTCIVGIVVSATNGTSLFEFDGAGVEAGYSSKAVGGTAATGIGYLEEETGFGFFEGDLHEIITVDEVVSAADRDRFFAYLSYKWGTSDRLTSASYPPPSSPDTTAAPVKPGSVDPNPLANTSTIAAKFDSRGELVWVDTGYTGVGDDIVEDLDGNLISLGAFNVQAGTTPARGNDYSKRGYLRKIIDNGDSADFEDVLAHKSQNIVGMVLLTYGDAEAFDTARWTKTNVTVAADADMAPDGATTADRLTPTLASPNTVLWVGGTGSGFRGSSGGIAQELQDGQPYTFSVHLKDDGSATESRVRLVHDGGTIETAAVLTYATGSIAVSGVGAGLHNATVKDAGDGWYRVSVTVTFDDSEGNLDAEITPDSNGATTNAILAWGAQMERGKQPSVYQADGEIEPYSDVVRMAVDEFGNVFVPGLQDSGSGTLFSLRVYDTNLELLHQLAFDDSGNHQGVNQVALGSAPDYTEVAPGVVRNLATFTESLNATGTDWTLTNVTVTDDNVPAPDGALTADLVDDTAAGSAGFVQQQFADGVAVKDGEIYTFSVYMRPNDSTDSVLALGNTGLTQFTTLTVDWSGATPSFTLGSAGGGEHSYTAVEDLNGFWRLSITATYLASGGNLQIQVQPDSAGGGTDDAWIWGIQLELGSSPTKYQPVLGSTPLPLGDPDSEADIVDRVTLVSPKDDITASGADLDTRRDVRFVEEVSNGLSPRATKLIGVEKGSAKLYFPNRTFQVISGGESILDQNARYISATTLYQRWFATDGTRVADYNPLKTGKVQVMAPSRGELPAGAELVSNYRGRLLLARTKDDPHAWFGSAIEDPDDWDYFSPPLSATQAVFHGTARAGRAPDIINSICPYDDQRLILGCDHALWYLEGDPLAGGTWQLLSDITGMHYGNRSWAKDPKGLVYFFGSRGGFYVMAPGGKPERMTENTIERRLTDLDLKSYYVEVSWNWRADGLNIYVIPFGSGGTIVQHYFWGRRADEWREDEFAATAVQPTASVVSDGDQPADRLLLMATEGETLLQWDEDSKDDDTSAISSEELFGPFRVDEGYEVKFDGFEIVLATSLDGATYELYASEDPENLGAVKGTGTLTAGRNPRLMSRTRGASVWLKILNSTLGESWAFENGGWFMARGGRTRDR